VGELCLSLHNVTLQVDKDDKWLWKLESSNDFTVRSAYKVLIHQQHSATTVSSKVLWHKDIPLKIVLFAWRLFRDRLPTKDNLFRRGVISSDALVVVVRWNLPLIYFYIVIFLGKSGTLFTVGWVSAPSSLVCLRITSINLVLLVVTILRRDKPFCN